MDHQRFTTMTQREARHLQSQWLSITQLAISLPAAFIVKSLKSVYCVESVAVMTEELKPMEWISVEDKADGDEG